MSLQISNTLFHGTISKINKIDVTRGRDNKDFGKGFYMALDQNQAVGMMHKKYREAISRMANKSEPGRYSERLYKIIIDTEYAVSLNILNFEKADIDWLNFILQCRETGGMPHNYDLVIGPTADDNTLLCLRTYWQGLYGVTGSDKAKTTLLENLEPENLGIQYFIGKQSVADRLIVGIEEINWR